MTQLRAFDKATIESDWFTDMPLSTQALYFHLGMCADNDGFVNNPKRVQRGIRASEGDLSWLVEKGFAELCDGGLLLEGVAR